MPGQLKLTTGSTISAESFNGNDTKLENYIRWASIGFGYNNTKPNDALSDNFQRVNDWVVEYLSKSIKTSADNQRLNKAGKDGRDQEQEKIDKE